MVGKTLGHYEILEPLGKGGMGEVYRARDTTLKREVAIKVLPEDLAADPDRLARLEREAHLLAALNHPNIATIHSLEQHEVTRFLVLELVKGEPLEQRLARGRLPTEAALDLCKQIAEALEAAHGEGIIHRDLKPANILITPQGRAKVLDFGLAKAFEGQPSAGDLSQSPTLTVAGTQTGVILGTAPYMSPEQVRGQPLDKRVDIWAFGCVLYEALTASRAFARETVADTLAAIIEAEPNFAALPAATPPMVGALVKRCLRKDPDRRLHDIADARIEIEEAITEPNAIAGASVRPDHGGWIRVLPWAVAAFAIAVAAVAMLIGPSVEPSASRWSLPVGVQIRNATDSGVVMSADGARFYFIAREQAGRNSVWVWEISELAPSPLPGTEGAQRVFAVSPDGNWLAYHAAGSEIWRVQTNGSGSSQLITSSASRRGAVWFPDDTIGYTPGNYLSGLVLAPVDGGPVTPLTLREGDEDNHRFPQLLPGGESILFTMMSGARPASQWGMAVASTAGGKPHARVVIDGVSGTYGRYVPTGHLLFALGTGIQAIPFDLETKEVSGLAFEVVSGIAVEKPLGGQTSFDFADNGTLVALGSPTSLLFQLVLVSSAGDARPLEFLPDNGEFSVGLGEGGAASFAGGSDDLLVVPYLDTNEEQRLAIYRDSQLDTRFSLEGRAPVWARGDGRLAYTQDLGPAASQIMIVNVMADGGEPREIIKTSDGIGEPLAFSNDGTALIYQAFTGNNGYDIFEYNFETDTSEPWLATRAAEWKADLSPDGERLAYVSGGEVYVRSYAPGESGGPVKSVSREGGDWPRWSADGSKLFYKGDDDMMMVVEMGSDPDSVPGIPEPLFDGARYATYTVVPDGTELIMWRKLNDPNARPVEPMVFLNFFEELKERVPTGR